VSLIAVFLCVAVCCVAPRELRRKAYLPVLFPQMSHLLQGYLHVAARVAVCCRVFWCFGSALQCVAECVAGFCARMNHYIQASMRTMICNETSTRRSLLLQHFATHCNALQHTATHCNTLPHAAKHCNTLQHTATHCNTQEYVILLLLAALYS